MTCLRLPPSFQRASLIVGIVFSLLSMTSCTNSRPDLVWTEDGLQRGLASFYEDHGDRTANGEIFNMYAMTAAHPSLALNSVVEVTNLANDRKVKVRINDRLPPIHEGRVIDLSKAAFGQLSPLSVGLLDVEIRVLEYGNNKYTKIEKSAPKGQMYITSKPVSKLASSKQAPSKASLIKKKKDPSLPVATGIPK